MIRPRSMRRRPPRRHRRPVNPRLLITIRAADQIRSSFARRDPATSLGDLEWRLIFAPTAAASYAAAVAYGVGLGLDQAECERIVQELRRTTGFGYLQICAALVMRSHMANFADTVRAIAHLPPETVDELAALRSAFIAP